MHFTGLHRAHNPVWSREPLSGEGAAQFGGRFNRIGRTALHTSLAAEPALREANQVGTLQPTTLVAYQADIGPLLEGRDAATLQPFGITPAQLADPTWRDRMLCGKPVPTQDLAEAAIAQGYAGVIVSSYARGAPADAINLVLWGWEGRVTLVDDDDRLGLRNHSWPLIPRSSLEGRDRDTTMGLW